MRWLRGWFIRLVGTFSREARERELAEELQSHVEFHIQDNVRAGMSPAEARRLAIIALGGLEQTRERVHEGRSLRWLEHLLQDVRYGVRVLRNRPGFTAAALFSLALVLAVK